MARVHWRQLRLIDAHGNGAQEHAEDCIEQLRGFRAKGEMLDWYFAPMGLPHETEDASTHGPPDPAGVDWADFPTMADTCRTALAGYTGDNPWQDVIWQEAGWALDEDATTRAAGSMADVVCFEDGGRLGWDERAKEWRTFGGPG